MPITDWPEGERPREKLLQRGAAALSDAELLAIFLRVGVVGKTAVDLARDLLQRYGSLNALFAADLASLTAVHGMGDAKYVQLQAVLEMARRALAEGVAEVDTTAHPTRVAEMLRLTMGNLAYESFRVLFLDVRYRVIANEELFRGSVAEAAVYPREIAKRALALNAIAVIVAHNHPSGGLEPSATDIAITNHIKAALTLVDVRLADHIIVTQTGVASLAERGYC
jgi:DNA repair protein RadC